MTEVAFEGALISLDDGESVLEGLLRYGHKIPNGCRAGVCQACIMRCDNVSAVEASQKGLTATEKALKYFLACQCRPRESIEVNKISAASEFVDGKVIEIKWLNTSVIRLRLQASLNYLPGQFVTLWKGKELARSYSIASHNALHDYLEFHIKVIEDGQFSSWVSQELKLGDQVGIKGPLGKCVYSAKKEQAILLAGIGTGLAPLYGILHDAIEQDHTGPIYIVLGASTKEKFYLVDELLALSKTYHNIFIYFLSQEDFDIYDYVAQLLPSMKNMRVFLCGAETFVKKMKKQCFMAGANMQDISADAFLKS